LASTVNLCSTLHGAFHECYRALFMENMYVLKKVMGVIKRMCFAECCSVLQCVAVHASYMALSMESMHVLGGGDGIHEQSVFR